MAGNTLEIIVQAVDNASAAMEAMSSNIERSLKGMQTQLRVVGAAFTAVGVTGLKMVSDARQINAQLGQTAITIGATTKELRNMVLATTDASFGVKSVTATFDLLARAGVRNKTEMMAGAKAFDALAKASDSTAEAVAELLLPAFKLFGEEIPQTSAELDKFTWLTRNTLVDLSDFGTLLTRMAPYMDTLNLSMDDAIAILAALSEKGITGTAATLKLRTAITQAAESGKDLNTVLGITQEEIDNFKNQMNGATGITDKYAKAVDDQIGIMAKLKQKWDEIALAAGSLLTPLEGVFGALSSIGPVLLFFSTAVGKTTAKLALATFAVIAHTAALVATKIALGAATAATWLFNVALSANPIGLVIIALTALVAAGILIWKNWSKIIAFFKGDIKDVTKVTTEEIQKQLTASLKAIEAKKTAARDEYTTAIENIRKVYGFEQATSLSKIEDARKASEETRKLLNRDLDAARKASSDRISLLNKEYDAKFKLLNIETEGALKAYQDKIDAVDARTEEEDRIIREGERQKRIEELRTEVARAATDAERIDAQKRLAEYLTDVERERLLEGRELHKAALRSAMEDLRNDAAKKRELLQTELDAEKEKQANILKASEDSIEKQLAGLEAALVEKIELINKDREAVEEAEKLKLKAILNTIEKERIAKMFPPVYIGPSTTRPSTPPTPAESSPYPRGSPYNPIPGGPGYIPLRTISALSSFQRGGIVPGLRGQPMPVIAHGGEAFLGVGQRAISALNENNFVSRTEERSIIVNINVEGSVVAERELAESIRKVFYDIRRHNFSLEMT